MINLDLNQTFILAYVAIGLLLFGIVFILGLVYWIMLRASKSIASTELEYRSQIINLLSTDSHKSLPELSLPKWYGSSSIMHNITLSVMIPSVILLGVLTFILGSHQTKYQNRVVEQFNQEQTIGKLNSVIEDLNKDIRESQDQLKECQNVIEYLNK